MNAKMNFGQKNGVFFEELFLSKLQEHMKVQSSDGTQFKYCCDIVTDDCLLEIKSHRDWKQTQTTQQVFTSITQSSINKSCNNGVSSGLLYQLIALLDETRRNNKKTMVIAGVYSIEVNQLYQLFLKNGDRAFAQYKFYDILLMDQDWSGLCRISSKTFWSLISTCPDMEKPGEKLRRFFERLRSEIEDNNAYRFLINCTNYADDIGAMHEIIKHCTIQQVNKQDQTFELDYNDLSWGLNNVATWDQDITEKKQLEINIEKQQLEINLDKPTQTWIEKEKQAQAQAQAQAESVEAVAEPVEAVAEPVEAVAEPENIIDQITVFSKEQLLMIRESIKDHVSLNDISKKLGKSISYLTNILNAEHNSTNGYRDGQWVLVRKWLAPILLESKHPQTPLWICNEDDLRSLIQSLRNENKSIRASVSKSKKSIEKLESKLIEIKAQLNEKTLIINDYRGTISEHEDRYTKQRNEINDLKVKLNSQETKQVDETTTLKLEAYQAEIKKLQAELEELQTAFDKLIDEAVTMNLTIKDQKLEIEQLKASSSIIKDQQIIDSLLLLIEKLK